VGLVACVLVLDTTGATAALTYDKAVEARADRRCAAYAEVHAGVRCGRPAPGLPPPADAGAPAEIVLDEDAPDPMVVPLDDGTYRMFTTDGFYGTVPMWTSTDLRTWTYAGDAMPELPAWAQPGGTWAPDVHEEEDGTWVLWFTAREAVAAPGQSFPQACIGVATADDVAGPYTPAPDEAICMHEHLGSIDAGVYEDTDGRRWLHWKSDDNALPGHGLASIWVAPLDDAGTGAAGPPTAVLTVDRSWEAPLVEQSDFARGPDGTLWLFYSANDSGTRDYGMGVARCDSPIGPCTKPFDRRWLGANDQGQGPGEASLFVDHDGLLRIVYSPWFIRGPMTPRPVALAAIAFDGVGPYLARPPGH
jgi:beta-xylosidase